MSVCHGASIDKDVQQLNLPYNVTDGMEMEDLSLGSVIKEAICLVEELDSQDIPLPYLLNLITPQVFDEPRTGTGSSACEDMGTQDSDASKYTPVPICDASEFTPICDAREYTPMPICGTDEPMPVAVCDSYLESNQKLEDYPANSSLKMNNNCIIPRLGVTACIPKTCKKTAGLGGQKPEKIKTKTFFNDRFRNSKMICFGQKYKSGHHSCKEADLPREKVLKGPAHQENKDPSKSSAGTKVIAFPVRTEDIMSSSREDSAKAHELSWKLIMSNVRKAKNSSKLNSQQINKNN